MLHRCELSFVLHCGCRRWFQCGLCGCGCTNRMRDVSFLGFVVWGVAGDGWATMAL